jgi:hypothetical protein
MNLPKSVRRITGPNEDVFRQIDEFFVSIRDELVAKGIENGPNYFEVAVKQLCEPEPGSYSRASDDMMHILKYKDRVIAIVSETRTVTNWVQFDFFKNLEGLL